MKTIQFVLFLSVISLCFAAAPVKKATATKTAKTTNGKSSAASKRPAGKGVVTRKGKAPVRSAVRSAPRQGSPTSDRYKEIQTALSHQGYLKSEPNGVWDAQSIEAMKQYQADHKMQPTGKLTAPALIGLGLGPKRDPDTPAGTVPIPSQP